MRNLIFVLAAIVFLFLLIPPVQAEDLYGYDGAGDLLYTIDTTVPSATVVGTDTDPDGDRRIPEIELGADGIIYAANTMDNDLLFSIDPATGLVIDTLILTFPPDGDVLTALEFVGDTLYAGLCWEDYRDDDSTLAIVNLTTGVVTGVGATGVGHPLGGLAYNTTSGIMYAVSGGGDGELFTINLSTGEATSVGPISVDQTQVGTTGLEFGVSGTLYALPNPNEDLSGHLLSVNTGTGEATDLGDTGFSLTALTGAAATANPQSIPTLSEWGIIFMSLILAGSALCMIRRRQIS